MEPTETAPTETGPTAPPDVVSRPLAALLGVEAVGVFMKESFGKDAFRTRMGAEGASRYFGWPQLNAALAEHRLSPPRLRLERAGSDATKGLFKTRRTRRGEVLFDLQVNVLNARLRDGATLILDSANELSPSLQRLCADLAVAFACPCQANMYACWGTTQGFDVHWDDHDVFVIQVEGAKRWALYGSTRASPTRRDESEHVRPQTPLQDIVLEPGDILYLPRGYWHAAVGLGGPTMHLTVGLTRKVGADFLHWLADRSLSGAAARADLPFEQGDVVLGAHLAGLLAELASGDPRELARLYRQHVEANQSLRPRLSLPHIGASRADVAPDATIGLAAGAARLQPGTDDDWVLSWRGTDFTVSSQLHTSLQQLVEGFSLSYQEFEASLPAETRRFLPAFVNDMVSRGAFTITPGLRS